jgi:thiopurine S-methyltransferase
MQAEFWHQRWKDNLIGFHQQEINEYLKQHWDDLGIKKGATVFVPLCGKSTDMCWLAEQGMQVIGVELSELAVKGFFEENKLAYTVQKTENFSIWSGENITVYCGDFFQLSNTELGGVSLVFDRAALVALPEEMRTCYAQKMAEVLSNQAKILQITMEYPQTSMSGPPFSVSDQNVNSYYGEKYYIENLQSKNILIDNPKFAKPGMTHLNECVFLLTKK